MAWILHLETATKNCSVSLAFEGQLRGIRERAEEGYAHDEQLHVFIESLMEGCGLSWAELSAVAVSQGPGSYTGLRIGSAAAKGLCYALDRPLIALPTLAVLARAATGIQTRDALIIPLLDARRAEVYTRVYHADLSPKTETRALILQADSFAQYTQPLYFLGDGVPKAREIIHLPQAHFLEVTYPSAQHMTALAYEKFSKGAFESLAYFEPHYLKDFTGAPLQRKD